MLPGLFSPGLVYLSMLFKIIDLASSIVDISIDKFYFVFAQVSTAFSFWASDRGRDYEQTTRFTATLCSRQSGNSQRHDWFGTVDYGLPSQHSCPSMLQSFRFHAIRGSKLQNMYK